MTKTKTGVAKQSPIVFQLLQPLQKLEAGRGGYYFFTVPAEVVEQLPGGRKTRLLCKIGQQLVLHCGLNPLGNGDSFIIVATRHVTALRIKAGAEVQFSIEEDTEPLGVEMPEVLQALLEQDEDLNRIFTGMTDGKKRSLIFLVQKIKDVDKQVQKATRFLTDVGNHRSPYKRS